jgi:hypothetical protein
MISYNIFINYCYAVRSRINIKGIILFNNRTTQIVGWPFARISAVNDNEAIP